MAANVESEDKDLPVSNRRDWLLCTGGLMTTAGVGWSVRFAYTKQPKTAIAVTLAGSASAYLIHMAVKHRIKKDFINSTPNWWLLLTTGILSWAGFGYYLVLTLKLHPRSTMIAYTIGSLYYILGNACFSNNHLFKSEEELSPLYDRVTPQKIADEVHAANARFHYISGENQCEICKAYVQKLHKERKLMEFAEK